MAFLDDLHMQAVVCHIVRSSPAGGTKPALPLCEHGAHQGGLRVLTHDRMPVQQAADKTVRAPPARLLTSKGDMMSGSRPSLGLMCQRFQTYSFSLPAAFDREVALPTCAQHAAAVLLSETMCRSAPTNCAGVVPSGVQRGSAARHVRRALTSGKSSWKKKRRQPSRRSVRLQQGCAPQRRVRVLTSLGMRAGSAHLA